MLNTEPSGNGLTPAGGFRVFPYSTLPLALHCRASVIAWGCTLSTPWLRLGLLCARQSRMNDWMGTGVMLVGSK